MKFVRTLAAVIPVSAPIAPTFAQEAWPGLDMSAPSTTGNDPATIVSLAAPSRKA